MSENPNTPLTTLRITGLATVEGAEVPFTLTLSSGKFQPMSELDLIELGVNMTLAAEPTGIRLTSVKLQEAELLPEDEVQVHEVRPVSKLAGRMFHDGIELALTLTLGFEGPEELGAPAALLPIAPAATGARVLWLACSDGTAEESTRTR